jgi:hypothetical protein
MAEYGERHDPGKRFRRKRARRPKPDLDEIGELDVVSAPVDCLRIDVSADETCRRCVTAEKTQRPGASTSEVEHRSPPREIVATSAQSAFELPPIDEATAMKGLIAHTFADDPIAKEGFR